MPPDPRPPLREASAADAAAIADLHARSWQSAYRGMMSDAYLDGPVMAERQAFWAQRLHHPVPGLLTLVADEPDGRLAGFVCALAHHDAQWGTLVDNLHVDPALKRAGLGRRLLQALGQRLEDRAPGPVYLTVLVANQDAAAFYARLGGAAVERMRTEEPDGSALLVDRIAWPSAAALVAGAA